MWANLKYKFCILASGMMILFFIMGDTPRARSVDNGRAGYEAGVNGDYVVAISLLTRALKSDQLSTKERISAYINRGVSYRRLNRVQEAIDDYSAALRIDPAHATALANRGLALAKSERYDEAIGDLTRAIALKPDNAKSYLERGNAYFDKGAYTQAIRDYDRAIELNPDYQMAITNRRDAYDRVLHPDQPCTCELALEPIADPPRN